MTNSTFSGNTASGGGGISTFGGSGGTAGTLALSNSTFSGNTASLRGGGILQDWGTVTVTNSTFSSNSGVIGGGIDKTGNATLNLKNTIVAGNTAPNNPDCSGFASQGHNLISNNAGCSFSAALGDLVGTAASPIDPLLGALRDIGGPTLTHALLSGSLAIDAGDNAACPATDQRGVARPQGTGCDIGAYELPSNQPPLVDGSLLAVERNGEDDVEFIVQSTAIDPEDGVLIPTIELVAVDTSGSETVVTQLQVGDKIRLPVVRIEVRAVAVFGDLAGISTRPR